MPRYWVVVVFLAAVVAGLDACTNRSFAPVPSVPGASSLADSVSQDAGSELTPDVRCPRQKVQPGWIFRGNCRAHVIKRSGAILRLPRYSDYAIVLRVPRNDARRDAKLRIVDAIDNGDIGRYKGKAFPRYTEAFLYLKTVDSAKPIRLTKGGKVSFDIVTASPVLGGACNIARLQQEKWRTLPVKGVLSDRKLTFDVPVDTDRNIPRGSEYFAFACAKAPTPSPSPSTSPSSSPTSPPTPADCSTYHTPSPNSNSAPQKIAIQDGSDTGAQIYLYVVTGAPPLGGTQTQYLATNGQLTNFTKSATAPPFPLACFTGSTGGKGQSFELPPPTNANQSANLYIAYATPLPNGRVPNPLPFIGTKNGGYDGPSLDWTAKLPGGASEYVSTPFDYVEYTLPNGITDVTQVDKVGLPIEVTQGTTSVGFASGSTYQRLLNAITATPYYKVLAVSGMLNNRSVLSRILSPPNGLVWGFPQDWWYNPTYTGATSSAASKGYVGYVLSQYQSTPRLYTLSGIAGYSGNYCASSDGTSNVFFYSVGSTMTCASLGSPTYTMPIANTLEGDGVTSSGICYSAIFSMPYGGAGGPLTDETEFYLWKAMVIDIARGTVLSTSTHPVGGWNTSPTTLPPFSDFYQEPINNTYAKLVHTYMIGNRSYALQYDEPGGYAPTFNSVPSKTLHITIHQIPTYSAAMPTTTPTPLPCPS